MKRIGHKGADALEPGNTLASFDRAREIGVDLIEFDVLPVDPEDPSGAEPRLAHDYSHDLALAPTLGEALAHLAGPEFAGVHFDVDLKLPGYERRVVRALREHGLVERSLISTQWPRTLEAVRVLEPGLRLGWSVPRLRSDPTASRLLRIPALGALRAYRRALPARAARAIRQGRCDALMAHFVLVTPRLVRAIHEAGGELYAWTVDDAAEVARLRGLGVDGIISNDPRLLQGSTPTALA